MKLYDLINILDSIVPEETQETWDNSGIQINCGNQDINKVLVALEITNEVINEAIRQNSDMIITHHPLIFTGIKSINTNNIKGKYITDLIKNNISVYSMHTNFDKAQGGNNDYIAEALGLNKTAPLIVNELEDTITRCGYCTPVAAAELAANLAETLNIGKKYITIIGDKNKIVGKVGICSGAGAEYIEPARQNGCDVFITGDVKYHDAVNASETGMCVIDAGHYGTERIFADAFINLMHANQFADVDFIKSIVNINPFNKI